MSDAETAVRAILLADATVSGLVSTRIYPLGRTPQAPTYPYLEFVRISGPRVQTLTGPSGLAHPRIQINCWARQGFEANLKPLVKAVREALDGYSGTISGTRIGGIILVGDAGHEWSNDLKAYMWPLDFIVWHDEV